MLPTRHLFRKHLLVAVVGLIVLTGMTGSAPARTITQIIDATGDGTGNTLNTPRGIAVDARGNVYVAGKASDNAFKITPGGLITEIIDSTGNGVGNILDGTEGIAVDADGNVYVTGGFSDNAFKITPGGVITEIIDFNGDGAGNPLNSPRGIALDAGGNVYVTGVNSDNAFKITPGGLITKIIDSTGDGAGNGLDGTNGIAVDAGGNVYVTGLFSDNAFKIDPGGVITEIIDFNGDGAGNPLNSPRGIALDAGGNVYVTGVNSNNAFKITPGGIITEIIDFNGDGAGNGLDGTSGIAVDAGGNVYVTGLFSDNAFKITPDGVITEIIDSIGDGAGNGLNTPSAIAVDAAGNVYVPGRLSRNAFTITFGPCGDGVIDTGEECDDFNTADGDGCSAICTVEEGFACTSEPSVCRPDCNGNGVPDAQDIAGGTSPDCNGGGVPDECDVDPADPDGNGLVSPDCNANGIPDECDLVSLMDFVHQSGEFSPFRSGANATEAIPAPPPAGGDVTLTVEVKADLGQVSEFVDVFLNGMPVGRLFESDGAECPATFDTGSLVIAEATFNVLLPGDVTVDLVPSAAVDACTGVVKLRLSYTGGSNDCNGNSVPDDCETDTDGDGVIDVCDPCPLDNPDDTDGDGVCDADDLCSDTPLGLLVDLDGCTLTEGPCCFPGAVCIDGTDRESCEAFPDGAFQGEGLTCGDPDGDGVAGCTDGCPLDPAKADPGVCGCGVPDDDGDRDGIPDCKDRCLQTPSGADVNVCGCAEVGACCAPGGACFNDIERTVCLMIAGIYQGDGSTCAANCALGDLDGDGDVDLVDFGVFTRCFTGAGGEAGPACSEADVDGCGPIDLEDFAAFRAAFTGP